MTTDENRLTAFLRLQEDHVVYEGHFPGQPVVPGVCLLQMAKELTETAIRKRLRLSDAANMKFLQPLTPQDTPILRAELNYQFPDENSINVSAVFFVEATPCFKLAAIYQIIEAPPTPA